MNQPLPIANKKRVRLGHSQIVHHLWLRNHFNRLHSSRCPIRLAKGIANG